MKAWSVTLLLVSATVLAACDGGSVSAMHANRSPASFASNGERIYFTGTSASGAPVTYQGGNMHFRMMGGGCVTCHGTAREGTRMMPEFWLTAPPLTRAALFETHDESAAHGAHAQYSAETLRTAISKGREPDGDDLDQVMPHWSMSDADWQDLIAFLAQ